MTEEAKGALPAGSNSIEPCLGVFDRRSGTANAAIMIRRCTKLDVPAIFEIVNDATEAYRGVIPADRWHEPYMPLDELKG